MRESERERERVRERERERERMMENESREDVSFNVRDMIIITPIVAQCFHWPSLQCLKG